MASKLTLWRKIGRFVTGLVVLGFFLPFFGVSCQGFDIVTITGADMVAGCKPGGAIADGEAMASDLGAGDDGKSEVPQVDIEPLAIIALACAIIGFGLAWVKTRGALIGTLVVSIAGVGALGGLYFKVRSNLDDIVSSQMAKKEAKGADRPGDEMGRRVMDKMNFDVGGRIGLWLTALAMLGVAGLSGLALKEKEPMGGAGVAGPPAGTPPGYPPQGYTPGGGYPPQGGGYPPQGGGYPPQGGGYPPQQG